MLSRRPKNTECSVKQTPWSSKKLEMTTRNFSQSTITRKILRLQWNHTICAAMVQLLCPAEEHNCRTRTYSGEYHNSKIKTPKIINSETETCSDHKLSWSRAQNPSIAQSQSPSIVSKYVHHQSPSIAHSQSRSKAQSPSTMHEILLITV